MKDFSTLYMNPGFPSSNLERGPMRALCVVYGGDLLRVVLGRASHTPDKPEIRDPIVFVAFDKHNIAPLHTYNPIYNYNIKLKKYNPKAVFSTSFSIVKMEQVAKSGYVVDHAYIMDFYCGIICP
ncbi:MAG: hypothetical protein ACLRPV_12600 [Lacrimispora saccharolytica]